MTSLIHYVLDSYHEVWLHGRPNLFLFDLEELDGGYHAQWPQLPLFMPRIMRLLSAIGFWRGDPGCIYQAWEWHWRFWEPIEWVSGRASREHRKSMLRGALWFFFTGRMWP